MDLATVIGILLSIALVLAAIIMGGSPIMFVNVPSMMVVVGGTLGVTLVGATLVGLHHSIREKRNLLPGAMQVASYLVGFLTLWAMLGALTILSIRALNEAYDLDNFQLAWGINTTLALQFAIILPNVVIGIWYLTLLSRGTVATRYANK